MLRKVVFTATLVLALGLAPGLRAELPRDYETLRASFAMVDDGRYDEALEIARSLEDPALRKLVQWRRLMRQGSRLGFGELADFLESDPDWPGTSSLRRSAERAMPDWMGVRETVAWFRAHPPSGGEAALRYARALRGLGLEEEARTQARLAWREMSFPEGQEEALLADFGPVLEPEDHYHRFERLLVSDDRSALRVAERLGGGHRQLAEARLMLAAMQPGVDAAIERIPGELRDDPGLTYDRARWRLRSDLFDSAAELLDPAPPVIEANAEHWWRIKHWAARRALRQGEAETAYRLAVQHGTDSGIAMAEGEFFAGWVALRHLDQPEQAYRHFDRLFHGVSMPISRARGAYWAGEAARALGREDWAEQWYRVAAQHDTVFYGQMAALRLGALPVASEGAAPAITADRRAAFDGDELVRATRAVAALERDDLLPLFFGALRSRAQTAEDFWLAGELAQRLGRPDQAIRTGRTALTSGFLLTDLLYPNPPVDLAGDPDGPLLLGLMRQESAFDIAAVSPAGARGLMQLMPGTAERVARQLGESYSLARLTSDPLYNIRLGRDYLERMLDRYTGFLPLALAAYNAGPGRADEWIVTYGDPRHPEVDPIDWMEQIPFSETRNYVQRVLESYTIYHRRLRPQDDPFVALPRSLPTAAIAPVTDGSLREVAN